MRIVWGIIGILLAYVMIRYRKQVVDWTGKIAWAERYLGMGGTYNAMVLFAVGVFLFSLLYMTGNVDFVFGGLGKFFGKEGGEN